MEAGGKAVSSADDLFDALAAWTDGSLAVKLSVTGPLADAEALGRKLADEMLSEGAKDLMHDQSWEHHG